MMLYKHDFVQTDGQQYIEMLGFLRNIKTVTIPKQRVGIFYDHIRH
jgi:hypothetical protein